MRIALIAIDYPPLRSSGAVQLRDLAQEFVRQGHEPVMMVPDEKLGKAWSAEMLDGVQVLRLAAPRTRNIGYVRRTIGEAMLSFAMLRGIRKSPFRSEKWDAVVWHARRAGPPGTRHVRAGRRALESAGRLGVAGGAGRPRERA